MYNLHDKLQMLSHRKRLVLKKTLSFQPEQTPVYKKHRLVNLPLPFTQSYEQNNPAHVNINPCKHTICTEMPEMKEIQVDKERFAMIGNEKTLSEVSSACTAKRGKVCKNMSCVKCFNKSAASSTKAAFWDKKRNGDLSPRFVLKNSHKFIYFTCPDCGHTLHLQMYSITLLKRWCKYCTNRGWCQDYCKICLPKTIMGHKRMKAGWDFEKNAAQGHFPHMTSMNCRNKRHFLCDKCNSSFFTSPNDIICHNQWCPKCKHKTEHMVYKWAVEKYGATDVEFQFRRPWLKNSGTNSFLSMDICIKGIIVIEIDGPQHFVQISNWTSPEDSQIRDFMKETMILNNNMSMIRVVQNDVLHKKFDWKQFISQTVDELEAEAGNRIVLQPNAPEYTCGIYVTTRQIKKDVKSNE